MRALLLIVLVGCGHTVVPKPPPPAPKVDPDFEALARSVGPVLRGVGRVDLEGQNEPEQIASLMSVLSSVGGKSPKDCHASLARLRVAIGEPLRIAAEIDGDVDTARLPCILGDQVFALMHQVNLVVADRPGGGIAISLDAQPGRSDPAIVARCAEHDCMTVELGPKGHRIAFSMSFGAMTKFTLSGVDMSTFAAAVASSFGAGFPVHLHQRGTELTGEVSRDANPGWAQQVKDRLLEAFKIPSSSMQPTLVTGDNIFAAKGALAGPIVAGDIVVHRFEDRTYVKRVIAVGGQTITETLDGIQIDGVALPITVVDPAFKFGEDDPERHQHIDHVGALVRESIGKRSYLTLRTGPPREEKSWTVPAGKLFLLGDNRNNSNDSRYQGPIDVRDVIGRVTGIWLSWHDGAPDWNRMGAPVE